jgi:two-component system LytT family response regulator
MQLNAIIVEDEFKVREVFVHLLQKFCPEINILGEAENIADAYELIIEKQPNVIFLDIEMPGGNGFELLARFREIPFEVVFVTSYSHYAIKAIKFSALDYLLKPVMIDDLKPLVGKLKAKLELNFQSEQYAILKENLSCSSNNQKLVLNTKTKVEYVNLSDITYLKGDGNYTMIHLNNSTKHYVAKTLKEYEDILCQQSNDPFVRIHKSYIANISFIKHLEKGEECSLILNDNTRLDVSRRKKQELLNKLLLK